MAAAVSVGSGVAFSGFVIVHPIASRPAAWVSSSLLNRNAAAELFVDMDADDLLERGGGAEAERERALGVEGARPARHHGGDHLVGLAADELDRLVAADLAQRLD